MQLIHYGASLPVIKALINASGKCSQKLGYECKQSRLFNSPPSGNISDFSPYGYWTSRTGEIMNFWAGAEENSYKCACGMNNSCFEKEKWCNCDSGKKLITYLFENHTLLIIIQDIMIGFGMEESSHKRIICPSNPCILVTLEHL